MNEFFKAFFPNFASTLLGLMLGLPLALWTNRLIISRGERLKQLEEQTHLKKALDVLSKALSFNRERLEYLFRRLDEGLAPFEPGLDYSAWDVSKSEITPYLHDPSLQQRMAYHFSRLASVSKLCQVDLDHVGGAIAAIGGRERTRDALRNYLMQAVAELQKETQELIETLKSRDEQSVTPVSNNPLQRSARSGFLMHL